MWKQKLFLLKDKLDFYIIYVSWLPIDDILTQACGACSFTSCKTNTKIFNVQILKGIEIGKQNGIKEKD